MMDAEKERSAAHANHEDGHRDGPVLAFNADASPPEGSVDAYRIVLGELMHKRQELDAAIHAIEQIIGAGENSRPEPTFYTGRPQQRHVRVAEAVRSTLEWLGRPARNSEIKAALLASGYRFTACDPDVSIVQALNRLTASKLVTKVGRGLWSLRTN